MRKISRVMYVAASYGSETSDLMVSEKKMSHTKEGERFYNDYQNDCKIAFGLCHSQATFFGFKLKDFVKPRRVRITIEDA